MTLSENYDLDITSIVTRIREEKATRVLLQLPDGLKPSADEIRREVLSAVPEVELFFWGGSCYGACDLPLHVDRLGFDLLIQLGHASWR